MLGIYRPPKPLGDKYYENLEVELNDLLTGDLNLDRLRPERREGKLLLDLEDFYNLTCLVDRPTRVTQTSTTLIDVMLTNRPDAFISSSIINAGLSDNALIYGIMNMKVKHYPVR
jgi:hypothetical protein